MLHGVLPAGASPNHFQPLEASWAGIAASSALRDQTTSLSLDRFHCCDPIPLQIATTEQSGLIYHSKVLNEWERPLRRSSAEQHI